MTEGGRVKMAGHAVLVATGDELLSGRRREGNCSWLAARLAGAGWTVDRMEVIPDGRGTLEELLGQWVGKADLVVLSGGLGPTHDDCTREALAGFLGTPLELDHRAYDAIVARYPEEMREGLERSRASQGAVPKGARAVHNPAGSALGIAFTEKGTRVYAFPGVPHEFRAMADQELAEDMLARDERLRSLFVVGWAESLLKDRLAPVIARKDLHISILPSPGVIEFVLRGEPWAIGEGEEQIRALVPGDCLPAGASSLPEAILSEASRAGKKIACAESCTGGLVGSAITEVPGSSAVFLGSAVCYSNDAKRDLLSVEEAILRDHGAVSGECALAMAEGARRIFGADVAVSVTGVAGPDGGTAGRPVGTVWFGLAGPGGARSCLRHLSGERWAVRNRAATTALELLWRSLRDMP